MFVMCGFFFFKQKTAYEVRISDWSSDVCSSDLLHRCSFYGNKAVGAKLNAMLEMGASKPWPDALQAFTGTREMSGKAMADYFAPLKAWLDEQNKGKPSRSEEHTSELQSLMRISYAVFCLKNKKIVK